MLIVNGTLATWGENNRILSDHALYVEGSVIRAVGKTQELIGRYPHVEQLDARGQLIMPGNICAHTHFYGAYARGMPIPGLAPENFPQILERLWWPLDKALVKETVRASALVCLVDAIRHGTTTLIDHHASPNFIDGSLDVIASAVDNAGLRAVLCYEVTDRDGEAKMRAGIAENVRFIKAAKSHQRVRGTFGLHASLTLGDSALRACADALPSGEGYHIHVAEHEADEENSIQRSGKRVVSRLQEYGIWGNKTIAAHCVHVDDTERQILQDSGTWVTHQPRSNMNNAVGVAKIDEMLAQGMKLCLGNDGFSNNMWAEWKDAYLLHKVVNRDPRRANGADIARVATYNNARLVEQFFSGMKIGELTEGAQADLIFVDYHPYTPFNEGNIAWHILFGFEASMITTTIVDGVVLMRDRVLYTLDEAEIAAEAMELAPKVWELYTKNAKGVLTSTHEH